MTKALLLLLLLGVSLGRPVEGQTRPSTPSPQITPTSPQLEQRDLPVSADDLAILVRAQALLESNSVWNRADDRECKDDEASGKRNFEHRLRDFNNLPETRLEDIHRVLAVAKERVRVRLMIKKPATV